MPHDCNVNNQAQPTTIISEYFLYIFRTLQNQSSYSPFFLTACVLLKMAGIQQQFVPDFSPERNLCPKCQTTMLSTKEEKLQHTEYSSREPDTFLLHSESISSLNESRLDNCHLCVQIWEVRPGNFRRLLRLERGIDQKDEQDANETTITGDHEMESTRLLYRWESTMKAHEKARRWDRKYLISHLVSILRPSVIMFDPD